MAYIPFQPKDKFKAHLYTANGSTNAQTIGLAPAFTWIKKTSNSSSHYLFDATRTTYSVASDDNAAQSDQSGQGFTSLDANGFTLSGTGGGGGVNDGTNTFASYNWAMGTTTVPSGGSITPSAVSIDTTAKQGIYKYTGNGTLGQTIAHGLGKAPQFVMIKNIGGVYDWACYHAYADGDLTQAGDFFFRLNTTATRDNNSGYFNDTLTTDTLITLGSDNPVNQSGTELIMYAFCQVPGYSRMGQFMGSTRIHGTFVYTGFKPAYILMKYTGGSEGWNLFDSANNPTNRANKNLMANTTAALETAGTANTDKNIDILSNGFKMRSTSSEYGGAGGGMIYAAFAEQPLVSSNGKSATAR